MNSATVLQFPRPAAATLRRHRSAQPDGPHHSSATTPQRTSLRRVTACAARRDNTEIAAYRSYTEAMLRRYFSMSLNSCRVPSLLGRELFRAKVTNYTVHGFDDSVIFVHDVERCMEQLDDLAQKLVHRIAIQEYNFPDVSHMLQMAERTVVRRYFRAIDSLSSIFLERNLLRPLPISPKSCQDVEA